LRVTSRCRGSARVGSLSPDSCRPERMPVAAELGQQETFPLGLRYVRLAYVTSMSMLIFRPPDIADFRD